MFKFFDIGQPWYTFQTINNEIYYVTKIQNKLLRERTINKSLVKQEDITIKYVLDNYGVARHIYTNIDFAVVNNNGKWLAL